MIDCSVGNEQNVIFDFLIGIEVIYPNRKQTAILQYGVRHRCPTPYCYTGTPEGSFKSILSVSCRIKFYKT